MTHNHKRIWSLSTMLKKNIWLTAAFVSVLAVIGPVQAVTTLTVEDVRRMAVEFNRTYLSAHEDVQTAEASITKAWAGALPDISVDGYYDRNLKLPSFFIVPDSGAPMEFKSGFKNSFGAALSVRQSLWEGGKVLKALQIAKLYKKYSLAVEAQVKSEVILNAENLFFGAILSQSNLEVLKKAYEANSYNLEIVEKYYSQGLVSEFEVLRARVEKSNLMPQLLQAESNLKLSSKRLKSYLGIDLNEEIYLAQADDDTSLAALPSLTELTDAALAGRAEMHQTDYLIEMARKAVGVAKGGYYPTLEAVSTYSWSAGSDRLTLDENTSKSWSAGLNLHIPIFNGGRTRGEVKEYHAEYNRAMLMASEARDNIKLEVEASYDQLVQAKKSLDIQGATIAQAEEGLNIANLRYESGVGTLLEVLSAQSALTQARNALAQAAFGFRQARAQLKKATTVDIK